VSKILKLKIKLVAFNLDKVVDEHGGHETANIRDQLSHLAKQREYGSLFGFF
jgi:protein-arginine kinase activator protein McsA